MKPHANGRESSETNVSIGARPPRSRRRKCSSASFRVAEILSLSDQPLFQRLTSNIGANLGMCDRQRKARAAITAHFGDIDCHREEDVPLPVGCGTSGLTHP